MTTVDLNIAKILDNLTEGYNVTLTREDGYKYILGMQYKNGEEVYTYQFGRIKREFTMFETILEKLAKFEFTNIEY